ncbi:hypothetical protein HMPREF9318_01278 [Streptococcus urinalis FB127-CNA-2]|uniref:Uncharacterized protein n=1 Tax=Streptococcus urinalis 2285-97 TaxID=764291 RepID=G5KCC7_9STRE|nr:hypothetical protein [Streptococcus urinalis]EHJ57759.1 hypothetical protein STRUR_0442 [Streptococcus urinalis 2285-97]EKS19756.1 hypothetical protein HMPREF9318_01278 [Streptococcus urinalis FB127-CNA-2]VEF31333.1 Uncharacterised protein [Streptococcus urinalis]
MKKLLLTSAVTLLTATTFATATQVSAKQTDSFKVRYEKWKKEQADKRNAEKTSRQAFAQ